MLNEFKTFNVEGKNIEELVALSAYGRALRDEYEEMQLEEPAFIDIQLKALRREIRSRNEDRLQSALKEKKLRLDSLKTPAEKKAEIKREIKELESQLASVA